MKTILHRNSSSSSADSIAATLGPPAALLHAACLTFIDGVGLGASSSREQRAACRARCVARLLGLLPAGMGSDPAALHVGVDTVPKLPPSAQPCVRDDGAVGRFGLHPFFVAMGPRPPDAGHFSFRAPTTRANAFRVLRAMQLSKPVLLEGSPGVGKTSHVQALGAACGVTVVRINLSEQTDLMDLLGSDLPVEGAPPGTYGWQDGAFLAALRAPMQQVLTLTTAEKSNL